MGAKWSQHRGVDQIHLITYVHKPVVFRSIRKQYIPGPHIYSSKGGFAIEKINPGRQDSEQAVFPS